MLNGYVQNGQTRCARQMFDGMPERDVVSWNTMLVGFRRMGDTEQVVRLFFQMERTGVKPTEFTLTTVISAIPYDGFGVLVSQLHALVIQLAFGTNVFVATALVSGYAKLGDCISLRRVFDEIPVKGITLWNALISGYMNLRCVDEARLAFEAMPERNIVSWTSLVNGYVCNKMFDEAQSCFNKMPERNVISWTVMISAYEKNGQFLEALELFSSMCKSGIQPNQSTFSSILSACAGCSYLVIGKQIHLSILKSGMPVDVVLSSSLVDMYVKCGHVNAAIRVFESMPDKNSVAWNSIICGYARHGLGRKALDQFERMKSHGVRPDCITFVSVLSACGHSGLVEEGERCFASMESEFSIRPRMEHYACMVDLYGRAGQLDKAAGLIREMPFEPDFIVLGALLGACGLHSDLEHGLFAAECMYNLKQDHPAIYSVLSKIYGDRGGWNRVSELRKMMKDMGAKKQKGSSWIEPSFAVSFT